MFQSCGFKPGRGDLSHCGFFKGCTKPGCLFINVTAQESHRCAFDCSPCDTIVTTHGNSRGVLVFDLIFEAPQGRRDKKHKSVQMKFCLLLGFSVRLGKCNRIGWEFHFRGFIGWLNAGGERAECVEVVRNGNTWGFIDPEGALDGWEMNPSFSRALQRHYSCSR